MGSYGKRRRLLGIRFYNARYRLPALHLTTVICGTVPVMSGTVTYRVSRTQLRRNVGFGTPTFIAVCCCGAIGICMIVLWVNCQLALRAKVDHTGGGGGGLRPADIPSSLRPCPSIACGCNQHRINPSYSDTLCVLPKWNRIAGLNDLILMESYAGDQVGLIGMIEEES